MTVLQFLQQPNKHAAERLASLGASASVILGLTVALLNKARLLHSRTMRGGEPVCQRVQKTELFAGREPTTT